MNEETTMIPATGENQEQMALTITGHSAVTMWNDPKLMNQAFRIAKMLSNSALVPENYRQSAENCLVAIDIANRLGLSPLMVMQNLYIVKGKPSWSGSFSAAAVNGSGRFTPLEFVFVGEPGTMSHGCYAKAIRIANGAECLSSTVTMQMAEDEGWISKPGSKWKTMPVQMMQYRAAAFFARIHCPDALLGFRTYEEIQDAEGYEANSRVVVSLKED